MPNISFDIFFDQDFINVTATRGKTAPRAKPEWKVRSAPKLPPKEQPADHSGAPHPPGRPKLNEGRTPIGKPTSKVSETSDTASQAGERRKPPKLGPRKKTHMATQWVLDKISGALAPTVSNAVSSAGGFAGGAVNAVGNSISGVGENINRSIRTYGDGVKDYGNSMMDWTSATGSRGTTAQNPLGLTGTKTAGKRGTTSPTIYSAPAQTKKPTAAAKKPAAATTKKTAVAAKPNAAKAPVSKNGVKPGPAATKKAISPASKPAPKKPLAAINAPNKPKAQKPAAYQSSKSAQNPIGISW